eukprot:TRINITY_DN56917_c0_g1_i1.p1 TRINITY_DN56917_c0_g1~~TRINITY_DN56917_c0_g1_i1.p1  ORF type:complete len:439 (-),score=67.50 TRINITY_DN56917_c0_g1_i1:122-1438(-)
MQFSEVLRQSLGRWSPDGKYLAAASQNRVLVREPETLKLVQVYICMDKVERIEWSPDSEFFFTQIARQGVVQIWSLRDHEWNCRIDEGLAGVSAARWGPTSRHLLVAADFRLYLSVWTLQESGSAVQIRHPKFADRGHSFSRDGAWLAVLRRCDCQDSLAIYNAEEGFSRLVEVTLTGDVADLVWSPDDSGVIIWERPGRPSRCHLYSLAGEHLADLGDCGLLRFTVPSPSAQFLAACGLDGRIQLLSATSRRFLSCFSHDLQVASEEAGEMVSVYEEEFEAPGDGQGGGVRYKRVKDPAGVSLEEQPIAESAVDADGLPKQGVAQAVWSPDDRYLGTKLEASPSAVWIWDLGSLALVALLKHRTPVRSISWDLSSRARGEHCRLAVTTADPVAFLWTPGQLMASPCPLSMARPRWSSDGRSLLLQERDRACICRLGP